MALKQSVVLRCSSVGLALLLGACAHTTPVPTKDEGRTTKDASAPGCAVAVAQNGELVESRAWGLASLEYGIPNTAETIFETGSVSKQFTAGALVMLEQQGKLSLDDPVRKYIPELPDIASSITIRQMLNHTSGLRDWGVVADIGGWPRGSRLHTMRQVVDIVARQKALNYEPGSRYSYNNSGYNLAAIVAERVSGKSLPQLTRELFFEPLGMTHSSWREDFTRVVPGRATAYGVDDEGAYHVDMYPENIYGNCCMNSTVGDLLKWNAHLARGGAFTEAMERQGVLTNGEAIDYANGLVVRDFAGTREVAHTGSTGGYRAFLARYPEKNVSVALLCNDGGSPGRVGREIGSKYVGTNTEPVREIANARAGIYVNDENGAVLNIFEKDGKLRAGWDSGPELSAIDSTYVFNGDDLEVTSSHHKSRYRRVEPWTPLNPAEYIGAYRSDEAEVTYRVALGEKGLTVQLPSSEPRALLPTIHDGFRLAGGTLIRFTRDASGRVDGFDIKSSVDMAAGVARVERLHFFKALGLRP